MKTEREQELLEKIKVNKIYIEQAVEDNAKNGEIIATCANSIYEFERELAELREQKQAGVYPKEGDYGYIVFTDGSIGASISWDNSEEQKFAYDSGNFHATEAEAERYRDNLLKYGKAFFSQTDAEFLKWEAHRKIAQLARESWGGEDSRIGSGYIPCHNGDVLHEFATNNNYGLPKFKDADSMRRAFDSLEDGLCGAYFREP